MRTPSRATRTTGQMPTALGCFRATVAESKTRDTRMKKWDIEALGAQERVLLFCVGSGTIGRKQVSLSRPWQA
jgi:hypothetical protein